ncbi:uncharacterized protein C16orf46 homolog [Discoglossus pictus]
MAFQDIQISSDRSGRAEEILENVCAVNVGKNGQNLIEALADISDTIFEDDKKSMDWIIGTGWEEAVCGWGSAYPTACLYPQKKSKKLKAVGSSSCILCLEMCQVTDSKNVETKATTETNLQETPEPPIVDNIPHAEKDSPCRHPDPVTKTETCHQTSSGEISNRQYNQISSTSSGEVKGSSPLPASPYYTKNPPIFGSPVVLPPLKATVANGHAEQKTKDMIFSELEKPPLKSVLGNMTGHLNNRGPRGERRLGEDQLKAPDSVPFISPSVPRTPSRDTERLLWQCSFHKPSAPTKQSGSAAPVGLLHTRTIQNRRHVKQDLRHLHEAKVRNRAKSGSSPLYAPSLLPSLTVTRVEIPVIHHRPL